MLDDGSPTGERGTRLSLNLRGRPKSMGNIPPVFDELASLANVYIPLKPQRLLLSPSTLEQLPPPLSSMPKFLKRKLSLTVDTKAAKEEHAPSSHDDDVFAAIFSANSRGYEDQIAEPSRNRATIHRSLSTSVISQRAESTPSPSPPLTEDLDPESPPQSLLEFSSEEEPDEEELLQAEYEKFRGIGRSKGWSEAEIDDLFDYILENGFPDLGNDFGFEFDPGDDDSDPDEPEIPKFTDGDHLVKRIERLYLQATFGEDICSTRQLEREDSPPATEDGQRDSLRTARNSIYLHSNSDISSNRTAQPMVSVFSSPSSNPSLDELSLSALPLGSDDGLESPAASRGSTSPNGRRSPIEGSPEVKDWCGRDCEPMDPGVTNLAAPQSDISKEELSEQSSSDNVDDILPSPQHETWPSPSTAASRDKLTDPDTCFEHDDVPLLLPVRYNKSAPNACEVVHVRPAIMGEGRIHMSVPEHDSNTSSFNGSTGLMTPPSVSSKEENDLALAMEKSSLAKGDGEEAPPENAKSSSDPLGTPTATGVSGAEEIKSVIEKVEECSLATGLHRITSKGSSQAGDDLAALTSPPTINNKPEFEFSLHPESLPVHTPTGSLTTEAQTLTANPDLLDSDMGVGNAFRKVKKAFSGESLRSESNSIAGMIGQPALVSTSNLIGLPPASTSYATPLPAPPVPASASHSSASASTTAPSSPAATVNVPNQGSFDASASNAIGIGNRISPPTLTYTSNDIASQALANMRNDEDKNLPEAVRKVSSYKNMCRRPKTSANLNHLTRSINSVAPPAL